MSDTPRTDAIAHRGYHLDALAARAIDLCRELERENAALRADRDRLDWLEHQANFSFGRCVATPECDNICAFALSIGLHNRKRKFPASSFRAAIDAARKEAQP